jgi:DNA-binding response OmpR family regulator
VARVEAVLRRAAGRRQRGLVRVGELTVDPSSRAVRLAGREVRLSAKEFALLHALAVEPLRVVSKVELLRDVWGYASPGATRTIDAHVCRLRKKLGGGSRPYVVNVRGVGYRLLEGPA